MTDMAITQERLEQIANEVVIHALENIGVDFVMGFIEYYVEGDIKVSDDEFDDIYESTQAIAADTIQRIMDRDG